MTQELKTKLAFGGENWLTTFVSLRDAAQDRRIETRLPDGRVLGVEFRLCGKSKSFLAVTMTVGRRSSPQPLRKKKAL